MMRSDGFYDYAWSPVTGCLNDCWYCYGKKDFEQRGLSYLPEFHPERLREPYGYNPSRIFVTHYTDLMGDFIPMEWVKSIIGVCNDLPKQTFMFLTKNPKRYYEYDFPDNCMLGVTVESKNEIQRIDMITGLKARKWISIEPILGDFTGVDLSQFELCVIGKLFNHVSKIRPAWVRSVLHSNIYYKPNVRRYL
jgi:protein gp37